MNPLRQVPPTTSLFNTTKCPVTRQGNLIPVLPRVSQCPVARVSALLTRNNALFLVTFAYKQRRPVPVMISHIAAAATAAVWIPSGSSGVIPENTARGLCVCVCL